MAAQLSALDIQTVSELPVSENSVVRYVAFSAFNKISYYISTAILLFSKKRNLCKQHLCGHAAVYEYRIRLSW